MADSQDLKKVKTLDEQAEWVMSFVADSDERKSEMEDVWDEVDDNYLVRPATDVGSFGTNYPLDASLSHVYSPRQRVSSILKDPETHQEIMTLLSTIVLDLFPVGSSFCAARAVGFEDIALSQAVSRLNEHAFKLQGQFWNRVMQILYALLRGTGVGRWTWHYQEEVRNVRNFSVDPFTGEIVSSSSPALVPVWDDPKFRAIDSRDFFPDHSRSLLCEMPGAAERFRINASDAMRFAEQGIYDKGAVERAIDRRYQDYRSNRSENVTDVSPDIPSHPDFMDLYAYEYYGETPFKGSGKDLDPEDGVYRRVITVINGETVRSKTWPRRLPYTEIKIIPRPGSFWGLSAGELVRFDQDFADTLKMMLADAVVRMTHPPLLYDKTAGVDLARLRKFNPRVPIGQERPGSVEMLRYQPPLGEAFSMYSGVKGQMRDASSALDSLQGQAGPDREAATVGSLRYQAAQSRPELFSQVCEREWLPEDGRIVTELYGEFLESAGEVARRIGASEPVVGPEQLQVDFDIEFIGSRHYQNRVQKIEAFREVNAAAASNPIAAQIVPWVMLYRKWFKDMGAEEIADMVGNPELIQEHTLLSLLGGRGPSNGNGEAQRAAPSGLLPAQTGGVTAG